jgi:superoxide reductase
MIRSVLIVMVLISEIMFYGIAGAEDPFGKINRGMDAKHTPVIEAPDSVKAGEPFQVTVMVGQTMHPSEVGHFVQWIELYSGDVQLARVNLTPTMTRPTVTFTVVLNESATLRALSAPNHSAAWEATKNISVAPMKMEKE